MVPTARYVVLVGAVLFLACSGAAGAAKSAEPSPLPAPIVASTGVAQAEFEAARTLLQDGRHVEAVDRLRLFQVDHPGDPVSEVAELYLGRALLGSLDEVRVNQPGRHEALEILGALSRADGADSRVQHAAIVYYGLGLACIGRGQDALAVIEGYPGPNLNELVVAGDRRWALILVAESLFLSGRNVEALDAFSACRLLSLERGESAEFCRERAFETAGGLSEAEAQGLLRDGASALVRAAAGWRLYDLSWSEGRTEAMTGIVGDSAKDFEAVGASDRLSEMRRGVRYFDAKPQRVLGAVVPLTGQNASVGARARDAMILGMGAFDPTSVGETILVFADSETDEAAVELLEKHKVIAMLGPITRERLVAMQPSVEAYRIPTLYLGAKRLTEAIVDPEDERGPVVFRHFSDSLSEARGMAHLAYRQLGVRRTGIVVPDVPYGRAMAESFREAFVELGGVVVVEKSYRRENPNFPRVAQTLAKMNIDSLFLPDSADKVAQLAAFMAHENIWGAGEGATGARDGRRYLQYLGTSWWQDPALMDQASGYVAGAVIPAWASDAFRDPLSRRLYGTFETVLGWDADLISVFAYDAVLISKLLIEDFGAEDRGEVKRVLLEKSNLRSVVGPVRFGSDGEREQYLRFVRVAGQSFAPTPWAVRWSRGSSWPAIDAGIDNTPGLQ
jgi:branched-chain amino acid transport system substrate-binding protein